MKNKMNLKMITGVIGALLFALSMMISHIPSNAFANPDPDPGVNCSGTKSKCVSHLPERLP